MDENFLFSFFFIIILFLILLFYLSLALAAVIRHRSSLEMASYDLRKAYVIRYDFMFAISAYIKKDELVSLRNSALSETDERKIWQINNEITECMQRLTSLLSREDQTSYDETKKEIERNIALYNKAVNGYNKKIFSPWLYLVSKICRLKRLEELK